MLRAELYELDYAMRGLCARACAFILHFQSVLMETLKITVK